jgi:hypothetical protein
MLRGFTKFSLPLALRLFDSPDHEDRAKPPTTHNAAVVAMGTRKLPAFSTGG